MLVHVWTVHSYLHTYIIYPTRCFEVQENRRLFLFRFPASYTGGWPALPIYQTPRRYITKSYLTFKDNQPTNQPVNFILKTPTTTIIKEKETNTFLVSHLACLTISSYNSAGISLTRFTVNHLILLACRGGKDRSIFTGLDVFRPRHTSISNPPFPLLPN